MCGIVSFGSVSASLKYNCHSSFQNAKWRALWLCVSRFHQELRHRFLWHPFLISPQHRLTQLLFAVQNRTSASAPLPNNQQVFNAYGAYQMMQAVPGQILTLTWPRTAEPDGTVADGSSQVNVYYNPNATLNAGMVAD